MAACTVKSMNQADDSAMPVESSTVIIFMLSCCQGVPKLTRNVYEQIKNVFLNAKNQGILIRLLEDAGEHLFVTPAGFKRESSVIAIDPR